MGTEESANSLPGMPFEVHGPQPAARASALERLQVVRLENHDYPPKAIIGNRTLAGCIPETGI